MDSTLSAWPPHVSLMDHLEQSGLLAYGKEIPLNVILSHWKCTEEQFRKYGADCYLDEWLKFVEAAQFKGFKVSERGMNGKGFRVLTREEMPSNVHDMMNRHANAALRGSIMLSNVPREGLDESHVRALAHEEVKAAFIGATVKKMLTLRKLPATPNMAEKMAAKMIGERLHDAP